MWAPLDDFNKEVGLAHHAWGEPTANSARRKETRQGPNGWNTLPPYNWGDASAREERQRAKRVSELRLAARMKPYQAGRPSRDGSSRGATGGRRSCGRHWGGRYYEAARHDDDTME